MAGRLASILGLNPLKRADTLIAEGDYKKAAEYLARGGEFERAGRAALKGGADKEAVRYFLKAALGTVDEGYQGASVKQAGELLLATGKHRYAMILFEHGGAFKKAAECALKLKHHAHAARLYERGNSWTEAAIYYERAGKLDDALRVLTTESKRLHGGAAQRGGLSKARDVSEIDQRRAHLLLKLDRTQEAIHLFQSLGFEARAASLLADQGKTEDAIRLYLEASEAEEAYKLLSPSAGIDSELTIQVLTASGRGLEAGRQLAALGRSVDSARAFEKAEAWDQAGQQWERARKHKKAAVAYQRANMEVDAARCYSASGEHELAAKLYERLDQPRAAAENFLKANRHLKAAKHFLACKDQIAALTALQKVPAEDPKFTEATLLLAPILLEHKQAVAAYHRLQLLSDSEESSERSYLEARALEDMGRAEEAHERYQTIATQNVNYRDVTSRLDQLREQHGMVPTLVDGPNPGAAGTRGAPPQETSPAAGSHGPSDALAVGSLLVDRYEILAELGRGGMGCVYRAHDRELNEMIAIKTLLQAAAAGTRDAERLLREVQICRRITHPNVVRVYDIGRYEEGLFVTMELVDGRNLSNLVNPKRPPSLKRIRWILHEIAQGLRAAHALGVIHRDLKPANLVLTQKRVKILDFGIARALDADTRLTRTGFAVGSPHYMAPEQLRAEAVDGRTDLYSLGVVAYTLIAGREPFTGANIPALVVEHLQTEPPPLSDFREGVPEAWNQMVGCLLAKDPNHRYASAEDLVLQLAQLPV